MYKINIVCVGDLKERFFIDAQAEYLKRLKRFCDVKVIELAENKLPDNPSNSEIESSLNKEGSIITPHLKGKVFVLSLEGKEMTSEDFADKLSYSFLTTDTITFLIGSSYGLSSKIKSQFENIRFSPMTFPHHLIRICLEEQIYRAFSIINHTSYHK